MLLAYIKRCVSPSTYRVFLTSRDLYRYSGSRNRAVVFVVVLISFLLTMLTGLIVNVDANWDKSKIRRAGSAAKVSVSITGKEQIERLQEQEQVKTVGLLFAVGETEGFSICYADPVCWKKILVPAIGELEGDYPAEKDEILLSRAYLERTGREDARPGDSITIRKAGTFRLSGVFTDYTEEADTHNIYVSESYAQKCSGKKDSHVTALITSHFVNYYLAWIINEECGIDEEQIFCGANQPVGRDGTIKVLKWILILLFLCGGLSVYNIFFAAVSADQKSYGLLSVIGMGHGQIFRCMRFQGFFLAVPGIILGGGAGILGQLAVVPWFMERFMAADPAVRSYLVTEAVVYPLIPLLSALLVIAMLTAAFAMVAWRICRLSPTECLHGISGRERETGNLQKPKAFLAAYRCLPRHFLSSKKRIRRLAWQNQKSMFWKNLLSSVSFLISCNFFLIVHSLQLAQGSLDAEASYMAQQLFCVRVFGDFVGGSVFCAAVISLCSLSFIQMRVRSTEVVLLQSIGMTRRQMVGMFTWEGVIRYLEFLAVFLVVGTPVWLGVSVLLERFGHIQARLPWEYGAGILFFTFCIFVGSQRILCRTLLDAGKGEYGGR